jgi:galactose oxidase
VRLTALTEAGGRSPWSNAAEINLLSGLPRDDPRFGVWSSAIGFPIVPAGAAQLPNGKLLTGSAYQPYNFSGGTRKTQTAILDPATSAVSQRTVKVAPMNYPRARSTIAWCCQTARSPE